MTLFSEVKRVIYLAASATLILVVALPITVAAHTSQTKTLNWTTIDPNGRDVSGGTDTHSDNLQAEDGLYSACYQLTNFALPNNLVRVVATTEGVVYDAQVPASSTQICVGQLTLQDGVVDFSLTTYDYETRVNSFTITAIHPVDSTPPTVPQNLRSTGSTNKSISLAWDASTDNNPESSILYTLYRNDSVIATTTSIAFTDTGLKPNTNYTYKVKATDSAGNSSVNSNPVTVKTKIR